MTEERIIITIDDSQLQAYRTTLDLVAVKTVKTFGGKAPDVAKRLPRLNRELRIILGRLPGMRELLALYTRAERMERGLILGGFELYLALITTVLILAKQFQIHQRRLERAQREYENTIRRARGWTHEEFVRGRQDWENYLKGLPP